MAARSRYWCFTENVEPAALVAALEREGLSTGLTYLCGQLELGEKRHLHFQGYCELAAQQRISWLKSNLSHTAHFEVRRGTQDEAIHYTCKPHDGCDCAACVEERSSPTAVANTFVEFGEPTKDKPGKRNDLLDVQARILEGATFKEVADEHFASCSRYGNFFKEYIRMNARQRTGEDPVQVIVHFGPTRTGKSKLAFDQYRHAYRKTTANKFFDLYAGEDTVIMEEFRGNWMPHGQLLSILDRYPCSVETKHGGAAMVAMTFIFTTNVHPTKWYTGHDDYWPALAARITEFRYFPAFGQPYVVVSPPFNNFDDGTPVPLSYDSLGVPQFDMPRNLQPGYPWN